MHLFEAMNPVSLIVRIFFFEPDLRFNETVLEEKLTCKKSDFNQSQIYIHVFKYLKINVTQNLYHSMEYCIFYFSITVL